jgi:polyisoprenoid-binding protein YceI
MTALQSLLADPATAGVWNLVPARSSVRFRNKTLWGLVPVNGEFTDVSGDGQITAKGAVFGRVDVRAASVKTGSPDFFDADAHPEISVVVTDVTPTGEGTADLRTELTVRGITRPVPLSATIEHAGDGTVRISTQTTVDRTAFGVSGNMAGMMPTTTTLIADLVFAKG